MADLVRQDRFDLGFGVFLLEEIVIKDDAARRAESGEIRVVVITLPGGVHDEDFLNGNAGLFDEGLHAWLMVLPFRLRQRREMIEERINQDRRQEGIRHAQRDGADWGKQPPDAREQDEKRVKTNQDNAVTNKANAEREIMIAE